MTAGTAEQEFAAFFAALKPGGVLGVVEHRANEKGSQDPKAVSGYVQQAYVIKLAADAGFPLA
jgi:predicted methyltransferase